jgi:hypothetical protein
MTGETKNAWDITCETAKLTQPPIKPNFDAVLDGVAEAAPFRNDFFKPILGTGYGFFRLRRARALIAVYIHSGNGVRIGPARGHIAIAVSGCG